MPTSVYGSSNHELEFHSRTVERYLVCLFVCFFVYRSVNPNKDGYFISCQWIPAPSPTLQLKVPPSPLFLRANRHDKWNIERFFGMPDADCLFSLENHGGHFAIRNRASNLFMSAEDHGLRADRAQYMVGKKLHRIICFDQRFKRTGKSLALSVFALSLE